MEIIEGIQTRRSVRRFLDKIPPEEDIRFIIEQGTYAPSACNRQNWRFIIITDPEIRKTLVKEGGSRIITEAPAGILVLYHKYTFNQYYPDNIHSAGACIQNILLASLERGLSCCWLNHLPAPKKIKNILGIPKDFLVSSYIAVGYQNRTPDPVKRKYDRIEQLISVNRFDSNEMKYRKCLSRIRLLLLRKSEKTLTRLGLAKSIIGDKFQVDHNME